MLRSGLPVRVVLVGFAEISMSFVPSNAVLLIFTAFVSLDADNTSLFISAVLSTFPSPTCAFVTECGLAVSFK